MTTTFTFSVRCASVVCIFLLSAVSCCFAAPVLSGWPLVSAEVDSITSALELSQYRGESISTRKKILESLSSCNVRDSDRHLVDMRIKYWEAEMLYDSASYDKAAEIISGSISHYRNMEGEYEYERLRSLDVAINWKLGRLTDLYPELKRQEKYYHQIKDPVMEAFICRHLGFFLRETGDLDLALTYVNKADSIYKCIGLEIYGLKNKLNIASILALKGNVSESVGLIDSLLVSSISVKDTMFYINLLITAYHANKQLEKKKILAHKAYEIASEFNDSLLIAKCAFNLGDAYMFMSKSDSAEKYFRQATVIGLAQQNHSILSQSLRSLVDLKKTREQWDSAFHYQSLLMISLDSMSTKANRYEIMKADAQFEKDAYERQLQEASARLHWQKCIILTILIAGIIVILTLVFGIVNFIKRNRLLKEMESIKQRIIDSQDRQLADYALDLNQKVNTINRISNKIDNLRRSDSISNKGADSLREDIEGNDSSLESWVYLKMNFEKEHPGYITRLHGAHPDLTDGEIRICVYILLGYSNKHIASILSVLPDSIKTFRYRIRKKISLDKNVSLEQALRQYDESQP